MKYIAYIIIVSLLRLLSLLPERLIYLNSDILYLVMYYLVRYRIKIVRKNLTTSLPHLNKKELRVTESKFYRHLADLIVENGVIPFYSKKRTEKMFRFSNPELINAYYEQGRDIILMTAHYNNWEWSCPLSYTFKHIALIVYKPLKNKYYDRLMIHSRTRFGAVTVPMGNIGRILFEYQNRKTPTLTGMAADQKPQWRKVKHWMEFMEQKTAVFTGSEKLAKKFNSVVVFMKVYREKRGKYRADIELITDRPQDTLPNEITERSMRILEDMIRAEPANWLWSHNRWKLPYEVWLQRMQSV